jgi:hypothetical protein
MLLFSNEGSDVSSIALRARFKIKFKDSETWHGHPAHDFRVRSHGQDAHATSSERSGTTESFRLISA